MHSLSSPSSCVLQYVNSSTEVLCWYRKRYWNTLWYVSLSLSVSSIVITSSVVEAENELIETISKYVQALRHTMEFHSRCSLRHSRGERHLVVGKRWMRSMELLHCNNDEQREMMSPLTSNLCQLANLTIPSAYLHRVGS